MEVSKTGGKLRVIAILKNYFHGMRWFFLAFALLAVIFISFPQIDIFISGLFYREGEGFFLSNNPLGLAVYKGVHYLTAFMTATFCILIIAGFITKKEIFGLKRRFLIFLLAALILAPGIVVNVLLKDRVGRPRPEYVTEFGGNKIFQPPFVVSQECDDNCSFVSGHASIAFYLMAFGLPLAGLARRRVLFLGFLAGCLVGFVRIMQGRHFFSDVVFAFFFVWMTLTLLYAFFYPERDTEEK